MTIKSPQASAYVYRETLCILGVCELPFGPVPFAVSCEAPGVADGPVNFNGELPEELESALKVGEEKVSEEILAKSQKQAVESLVLRARQGDQNARAMLHGIGIRAKEGVERAQKSLAIAEAFIAKHPATENTLFGNDQAIQKVAAREIVTDNPLHYSAAVTTLLPLTDLNKASVMLANGPSLLTTDAGSNPHLDAIAQLFNESEQLALTSGCKYCTNLELINDLLKRIPRQCGRALLLGYVLGVARKIQAIRLPESPCGLLSPLVAWELD